MIRMARAEDIPAILDIYAPYVLTTTATFEYTVPTYEDFSARFADITKQFPWLVWEENGKVLGYAYASAPSPGQLISGAPSRPFTFLPKFRAKASANSFTPSWKNSCAGKVTGCSTP